MNLDSIPLSSSTRAVPLKAPGTYEEGLSGFRASAGEAAFSHTEVLPEAIVPLLSPPPTLPACTGGRHI